MACIQKKKLLDGTISYRVQVKAKNPKLKTQKEQYQCQDLKEGQY